MYEIQRIYIFLQNDWKRHYHSLVHWIITKHFAYANVGKMFLMFFRIGVTNWHSIVIAAEGSIITLVVNMNTCKYNWKGLNESAFPAHLYLSQFYIFRDHAVNFTVDLMQGVFIDRFHHIDPTKTYNFNAPTLDTSASHKITAKYGILCPKTLLLTEKQLHAIHFFVATCNVCPLAIP